MAVTIDLNTGSVVFAGQSVVTDNTSTTATLQVKANKCYKFTRPLTQLTIESVENSVLESEVIFTAGSSIKVTIPESVAFVSTPSLINNKRHILSIKHNTAVLVSYSPKG